ncbi:MAG: zinc ribbon domain-containing protein [Terriglobia bacterium]
MAEYCTCGTQLVENARFCHACGRPTRDEIVAEEPLQVPLEAPAEVQTKITPAPVSFRNPIALRVAFLMSLAIMMMQVIPVLNRLFFVWWLCAGWCAVPLYRRFTGFSLSVRSGARLGSITGVLTFVSLAVVLTMTFAVTGKQMLDESVKQDPRMSEIINNPPMVAFVALIMMVVIFALVVGTCAAGGALGARFSGRRPTDP